MRTLELSVGLLAGEEIVHSGLDVVAVLLAGAHDVNVVADHDEHPDDKELARRSVPPVRRIESEGVRQYWKGTIAS